MRPPDPPRDLVAWLRLTLTPGLPYGAQLAVLKHFGGAEQVFTAASSEVVAVIGNACTSILAKGAPHEAMDKALKWLAAPNHFFIPFGAPEFPWLLAQIPDPPCAIYAQGRLELLNRPAFAIVGSRNATIQGARDAESLAFALSEAGLAIVSGLALGVDAAAHRGGLRGASSSIAVVGTGADRIYPRGNRDLAHRLAKEGVIISEFPLGTSPRAGNFPRRNRLISGLAKGVLVVEAALQSGSLITARLAGHQSRDVFAIPGPIHSPVSKGCHQLLRDGAKLVETVEDILCELKWGASASPAAIARKRVDDPMLDAMGHAPVSIDQIAARTGDAVSAIAARLAMLELEGAVTMLAGGYFQRLEPL